MSEMKLNDGISKKITCIVIDDDQNIVDVFCELLNLIDLDVLATGNNGKDAVDLYEKHSPDIVFTDLQMPEYDGLYAVESIKSKNIDAKIIIVTGDLNASDSIFFNSLGICVINKPFKINTVKQVIVDALLDESKPPNPFEIQYKFKEDDHIYSCVVTFEQYCNLKKLPIVQECEVIDSIQKNNHSNQQQMEKALELACKNDTKQIRELSEVVR